jgi:hypothetical protein
MAGLVATITAFSKLGTRSRRNRWNSWTWRRTSTSARVSASGSVVVGVAVVAQGGDDGGIHRLGNRAHAVGPPPRADRRHLGDRADAAGLRLQDLGDRPSSVLERLAREGRESRNRWSCVSTTPSSSRTRDADDVTLRHVASDLRCPPAR